jgi:hypothetical protein
MLPPPVTDLSLLIQPRWAGLTEAKAKTHVEAASVCLELTGKEEVFDLYRKISGRAQDSRPYRRMRVTEQLMSSYADPQEATEQGAYGIAMLLARTEFNFAVVKRAFKGPGSGVDYWLGQEGPENNPKLQARLEVSGILNNPSDVEQRLKIKRTQAKKSESSGVPAMIAIVEFGTPIAVLEYEP